MKEPKIKMERNGKDGRKRRKRSARWIDGAWNRGEGDGSKKGDLERYKRKARGERKGWKEEERRRKWNSSMTGQ